MNGIGYEFVRLEWKIWYEISSIRSNGVIVGGKIIVRPITHPSTFTILKVPLGFTSINKTITQVHKSYNNCVYDVGLTWKVLSVECYSEGVV